MLSPSPSLTWNVQALWVLAATTGRRSEPAGADRQCLDLDGQLLTIADTRVVVDGSIEDEDGKSDDSVREISLDAFTVAALRKRLAMLDQEQEAFGKGYAKDAS